MLREKPPLGNDGFSETSSAGCLDNSEIARSKPFRKRIMAHLKSRARRCAWTNCGTAWFEKSPVPWPSGCKSRQLCSMATMTSRSIICAGIGASYGRKSLRLRQNSGI